jgi:mono/diheme cytochrome c family protein
MLADKLLYMKGMKKLFHLNSMLWQTVVIAVLANINIASGQTGKKHQFPIPEDINKIFQTSCMPCHGSNGGRLPKSMLNFSRWAGYGPAKEVEKLSLICSALRKGAMPPRSARKSKPELVPTKEQIDLICKWAESLKSEKGEK